MYGGAFAFQNRLGQLIVGRRFTIFALFYFVFEGKFPVQAPPPPPHPRRGGTYIWRGDLTKGFLRSEFGGLIFGGGYIWRGLFSEFYGNRKTKKNFVATHPLSGSKAISLGSSSPKDSTVCWLLPDRSDLDIVSCVVSVQYNSDVVH